MAYSTTWWNILNIVWYAVMGQRERCSPVKSHHRNSNFTSPWIWPLPAFISNLFLPITMFPRASCWRFLRLARLYLIFLPVYSCYHYLESLLQNSSAHTSSRQGSPVSSRVRLPGFKSQLPHLLVVWLWISCLTSPGLSWFICKMSIVII